MEAGVLFLVDDDQLHPFTSTDPLSNEVIAALQNDLGVTVGETVLPIAHWEDDRSGPLSIALNGQGELVALVLAEPFLDQHSILATLSTLEQWLAPMSLAELGDLSGDRAKFEIGLTELSPHMPIELASMVRILLVNPPFVPNNETLRATLPFSRIESLHVEAAQAVDGTVVVSKLHTRADLVIDLDEPAPKLPVIDLESITTQASTTDAAPLHAAGLTEEEDGETIDLVVETPRGSWPTIIRGSIYQAAELPLYFDPTGAKIESLSYELFAVDAHLALVVNLDNSSVSPVETADLFRWSASIDQNELLDRHSLDSWGRTRTMHLFVECESAEGQVFYLGRGERIAHRNTTDAWSVWFTMSPPLDAERLQTLRTGRLPADQPSFSFASKPQAPQESASDALGSWVPNR